MLERKRADIMQNISTKEAANIMQFITDFNNIRKGMRPNCDCGNTDDLRNMSNIVLARKGCTRTNLEQTLDKIEAVRKEADDLWKKLGGKTCICQELCVEDALHWVETSQQRT